MQEKACRQRLIQDPTEGAYSAPHISHLVGWHPHSRPFRLRPIGPCPPQSPNFQTPR